MDRYYKANEEVTLRFYQMPKALFNNPIYKGLSLEAKAIYSILMDRQDLSIESCWVDEKGNTNNSLKKVEWKFIEQEESNLIRLLAIDRKKFMTYKKELTEYGLMIDKSIDKHI